MTSNELIVHSRLSLLKCSKKFNVSFAYEQFGVSRTRYYEIKKDFLKYGKAGLLPEPKIPNMPNKIRDDVEKKILSFVRQYPTYGPVRIANELKRDKKGFLGLKEWMLPSGRMGEMIKWALYKIGKPAHFSQITLLINELFPDH